MKIIRAGEFAGQWAAFVQQKTTVENWASIWKTRMGWYRYLLGSRDTPYFDCPFGLYLKKTWPELRYSLDDGFFNLSLSLHPNLKRLPTLNRQNKRISFYLDEENYFPAIHDVLMEHEDDLFSCWSKLYKLTCVRAYLKVLVTYYTIGATAAQREKEHDILRDLAHAVIRQATRGFTDHEHTEYLVLAGWKENDVCCWNSLIYDMRGELKHDSCTQEDPYSATDENYT